MAKQNRKRRSGGKGKAGGGAARAPAAPPTEGAAEPVAGIPEGAVVGVPKWNPPELPSKQAPAAPAAEQPPLAAVPNVVEQITQEELEAAAAELADVTDGDPTGGGPLWLQLLMPEGGDIDIYMADWSAFAVASLGAGGEASEAANDADALMHEQLIRRQILTIKEATAAAGTGDPGDGTE